MAKKQQQERPKIGLCLGGGGARGFAHIGALKAFKEEGIAFDLISGTSVGSLIGGLYAAGLTPEHMEQLGDKIDLKDVRSGFTPNDPSKIGNIVRSVVGDIHFEDLRLPLFVVSVDLVSAKQIILDRGPLHEAISASCAVPILFKPFVREPLHLVDGGLLNNIPADVCRMMGANYVVTVDINPTRGGGTDGLGIMDVAKATLSIVTAASSQTGLINSDIIIAPDLKKFKATKKEGHTEMIRLGYEAAKQQIPAIKELLSPKVLTKQEIRAEKREEKKKKKEERKNKK